MVLKDVSYLKRGNYIYIYGHWLNMEFSQQCDTPYWKIFTKNNFFLKLGFRKEDNYYKLYIPYGRSYEYSAFYKYCYCKYQGGNILRIRLCQMVISSYTQIWKLRHAY